MDNTVWIGLPAEDMDFIQSFDPATELETGQGAAPADLALGLYNFIFTIRELLTLNREDQ
ncbi:MAG: hypothetical protein M3Q75_12745 [Gemmatimonadota bacterium]|nr:hypothetical protein [Gemmatimonadota bacterium]